MAGSLNWIANFTRPDICFALSNAAQHISTANETLYNALIAILAYLDNTAHYRMSYGPGQDRDARQMLLTHAELSVDPMGSFDCFGMTDTSHGGPRPMACAIVFAGGGPVAWKISRLTTTPMSSCEGEYDGASRCATIIQWVMPVAKFLMTEARSPTLLFCDNKAACMLSESNLSSKRMRHVATRLAYLKERVSAGEILMTHLGTDGNLADIGTKILSTKQFHRFRPLLVRGDR